MFKLLFLLPFIKIFATSYQIEFDQSKKEYLIKRETVAPIARISILKSWFSSKIKLKLPTGENIPINYKKATLEIDNNKWVVKNFSNQVIVSDQQENNLFEVMPLHKNHWKVEVHQDDIANNRLAPVYGAIGLISLQPSFSYIQIVKNIVQPVFAVIGLTSTIMAMRKYFQSSSQTSSQTQSDLTGLDLEDQANRLKIAAKAKPLSLASMQTDPLTQSINSTETDSTVQAIAQTQTEPTYLDPKDQVNQVGLATQGKPFSSSSTQTDLEVLSLKKGYSNKQPCSMVNVSTQKNQVKSAEQASQTEQLKKLGIQNQASVSIASLSKIKTTNNQINVKLLDTSTQTNPAQFAAQKIQVERNKKLSTQTKTKVVDLAVSKSIVIDNSNEEFLNTAHTDNNAHKDKTHLLNEAERVNQFTKLGTQDQTNFTVLEQKQKISSDQSIADELEYELVEPNTKEGLPKKTEHKKPSEDCKVPELSREGAEFKKILDEMQLVKENKKHEGMRKYFLQKIQLSEMIQILTYIYETRLHKLSPADQRLFHNKLLSKLKVQLVLYVLVGFETYSKDNNCNNGFTINEDAFGSPCIMEGLRTFCFENKKFFDQQESTSIFLSSNWNLNATQELLYSLIIHFIEIYCEQKDIDSTDIIASLPQMKDVLHQGSHLPLANIEKILSNNNDLSMIQDFNSADHIRVDEIAHFSLAYSRFSHAIWTTLEGFESLFAEIEDKLFDLDQSVSLELKRDIRDFIVFMHESFKACMNYISHYNLGGLFKAPIRLTHNQNKQEKLEKHKTFWQFSSLKQVSGFLFKK